MITMIGWRGRIGLMVPSTNTAVEYEYAQMVPKYISIHVSRVYTTIEPNKEEKNLIEMGNNVIKAAKEVASVKPVIIAFCCTSGSFIKGEGYDREIINNIERETNIPAITTSTAVLEAFKQLGLKKVAMTTPYNKEITEKEVKFFERSIPNFKVVSIKNLDVRADPSKGNLHYSSAYTSAKEVNVPEAEAIFISCTNWRTIEIIDLLENDLGKPVITSNQATMWAILKKMGIHDAIGYGSLFREL